MYDVIVLGGGPGGYRAAELAGKSGLKTAIIEKDYLGGMCLNRGCIPTKAYYSDIVSSLNPLEDMLTKKDKVISTLRSGVEKLMQLNKVDIINGYGTIKEITTDVKQIEVKTSDNCEIIEGKNLIIATGSKTLDMNFPNNDLPEILRGDYDINNKDLWDPESDVKSIAIAGAGVIAIEFAVMLKKLGKEVTILKHSDQILRKCDEDIKKRLASNLKRMKIKLLDYFEIKNVEEKENKLIVNGTYKKGDIEVECDRLVLASSMVPIIEGYGLENSGLEYDRKGIKTDEHKRTNIKGVYAIGDVTGGMMLAHVAEYEAMVVVDDLLGKDYTINYNAVPACVFAEPEIATVGITERDAKAEGINIKIGRSYFRGNGMALAMNRSDGFVKVIADENNKLLGTHIMGPEASALIGEAALAIHAGLTADEVAKCVHAHPTLAECFKDALFNLLDD